MSQNCSSFRVSGRSHAAKWPKVAEDVGWGVGVIEDALAMTAFCAVAAKKEVTPSPGKRRCCTHNSQTSVKKAAHAR